MAFLFFICVHLHNQKDGDFAFTSIQFYNNQTNEMLHDDVFAYEGGFSSDFYSRIFL